MSGEKTGVLELEPDEIMAVELVMTKSLLASYKEKSASLQIELLKHQLQQVRDEAAKAARDEAILLAKLGTARGLGGRIVSAKSIGGGRLAYEVE